MDMNDKENKLNTLREQNPFTSSSVGDPWEDKYPDVRSVNERAFKEISQLIDQKSKNPALGCAGLVFGEVGSGKTHLVGRILKYGRQAHFPFSFAYIQPIEDPEQTYRYLLREVMVNLCYPIDASSDATQLSVILDKIFAEVRAEAGDRLQVAGCRSQVAEGSSSLSARALPKKEKFGELFGRFRKESLNVFKKKKLGVEMFRDLGKIVRDVLEKKTPPPAPASEECNEIERIAVDFLRARFPDIPKEFLRVLFQYQSPEKRSAAMDWLKGIAIDNEDAALLRVMPRLEDSPAMLEQKSRNILSCFGVLLVYYGQPLVICFDRLENYDTDEKIHSLGKMVEFLVDRAKAILPLVFVRGQQWEEKFTKKLNQQVITRLKTNEFQLKGCNDEQSAEIVRTRLATVLSQEDAADFFPFDKAELTNIFKTRLHSPRQVIMFANQRLKQILYPDKEIVKAAFPIEKLEEEFAHQYRLIQADFNRYQPDRSRLKRALELYLSHNPAQSGFAIESLRPSEDKYTDFECMMMTAGHSDIPALFIIDIEVNNPYIRACLKRGIDFLEKYKNGKVFYIRELRCAIPPPPAWKTTNDMLDTFRTLGGYTIFLDKPEAGGWYALALLNYAVKEGDVTVTDSENRTRSVSSEEMAIFVREKIHGNNYPYFKDIAENMKK